MVISDENFNKLMPTITVLPITSLKKGRRVYPNEVHLIKGIGGFSTDSIVLVHQIRTISKKRLKRSIGTIIDEAIRERTNEAMKIHLNLY